MKKYKRIEKNNSLIRIKSEKRQELCYRELNYINEGRVKWFLPVTVEKKKDYYILEYNFTQYVTLDEFLSLNVINKKIFVRIVTKIIDMYNWVEENHFNRNIIYQDLFNIMIDTNKLEPRFIYVALQPEDLGFDVKSLFMNILQNSVFDSSENLDFLDEYLNILEKNIVVSLYDIKNLLSESKEK